MYQTTIPRPLLQWVPDHPRSESVIALVIALVVGAIGGWVSGGRIGNLAHLRVRYWPLLFGALALELVLGSAPREARWALAVADGIAVAGWFLINRGLRRRTTGPLLMAGGTILNSVVMAANGGMPVSRRALAMAGFPSSTNVAHGHLYKHVAMTASTHLRFLGDVIPLSPVRMVVSVGDLVMLAGIAVIVTAGCHAPTAPAPPESVLAAPAPPASSLAAKT
jgi:hypothetical protein